MRSDLIKEGVSRAPHRGLLRACGVSEKDFKRPFIAIVSSRVDIIPGHVHLETVAEYVLFADFQQLHRRGDFA